MKYAAPFLILALLVTPLALGCSFGGTDVFRPTLERWEEHAGPKQKDENADGDYWEKVPAPVVRVISITRGSKAPGSDCGDAGVLELEISLPPESTYAIDEFGFYFRVVSGKEPDEIFPNVPLVGTVEGGKARLTLAWLDGRPQDQIPLNLEVEVFLVTNSLNVGPSTRFKIRADAAHVA